MPLLYRLRFLKRLILCRGLVGNKLSGGAIAKKNTRRDQWHKLQTGSKNVGGGGGDINRVIILIINKLVTLSIAGFKGCWIIKGFASYLVAGLDCLVSWVGLGTAVLLSHLTGARQMSAGVK